MLLPQWWHLLGQSLCVPRGVGGISLWDRSIQARQHRQLMSFLGTPLLWEASDLPLLLRPAQQGGSASSDMALLARWGHILHPLLSLFQTSNVPGEDIAGFSCLWSVANLVFEFLCLKFTVSWKSDSDLSSQYWHLWIYQCLKGYHLAQHSAGQWSSSVPATNSTAFGWVTFPTPGIALGWLTPISVLCATAWHCCNWSGCSQ